MTDAVFAGSRFNAADFRPRWLRPAAIAIVLALHGATLLMLPALRQSPHEKPTEVIVDVEPETAPTPAERAPPPAPAESASSEAAATAPQPEAAPPAQPPPPITEAPPAALESPAPAVAKPPPEPPPSAPVELAPPKPPLPARVEPKAETKPSARAEKALQRTHEAEPKPPAPAKPATPPKGAPAEETRVQTAAANAEQQSAYAASISAAIRSRLAYPAAARARGARGVVGVAFTIGDSGAVTSFSITHSSGDADLDAAARTLVQSARFPPPPAGPVRIATSFNYIPR